MAFTLQPLEAKDVPTCVAIYFASFQNAHSLACWPRNNAAVREWWENMILTELDEPGSQWLKAVDTGTGVESEKGQVVGFCKWRFFRIGEEVGTELPSWPEGSDEQLCERTFGAWAERHPVLMGSRRRGHWYLEILATDPKYQGRGAGSQMMRFGLEQADKHGMEAYLEASPDAVRLYERFGFREAGRTDTWIENERVRPGVWYRNLFMIRPVMGGGS
ncbi:hypothetical protein LTR62_004884 [Meristemomyces frigidus]|uniref:N-acetyltransferase domain-containing protein n=1 Tax=Meristemomyces frigidus TaxID=1508187 RepID=A0AAN7TFQ8_9PEZI|nr:hypothetical protein LTR62_004884 [Meristemomyces frigidus]